ncbi:MAG: right-handed parallel beta-helix repeat-containing protein [Fimbriimonadaceae bacterium]|nr:right-handed parallel beta-helix repeat-containing protein [Fimbriimonadaceae bacterium]
MVRALAFLLTAAAALAAPDVYVAPHGRDAWSGRLPTANAAGTDGPLASPAAALAAARRLGQDRRRTIQFAAGRYELAAPLRFLPADSHLRLEAAPGALVELAGGPQRRGWQVRDGRWTQQWPAGTRATQLFVNGRRAVRARTPNDGALRIAGFDLERPRTAFVAAPDDFPRIASPDGAMVVVYHSWETSLLPLQALEPASRSLLLGGPTHWPMGYFGNRQRYHLENRPEWLDAPGEWYLAPDGLLTYLPRPGEQPAEAVATLPQLSDLVQLVGEPAAGLPVTDVTFAGLAFADAAWELEPTGHSDGQAVWSLGAALTATGAVEGGFVDCRFTRLGRHALWFRRGCRGNRVERCQFDDLGGSGVRIGEMSLPAQPLDLASGVTVDNCWIHHWGEVYNGACGILVGQAADCVIRRNELHDGWYTGISLGWNWGRTDTAVRRNLVEGNHIHHLVKGRLSDAGGIYTLGRSDGSVLRRNVIHGIYAWDSPRIAWGIYLDAETHGYLVEQNLVYQTTSGGLMLHNGAHQNVIRNNLFAKGADHLIWRSPASIAVPNVFERNICLSTQGDLFYFDAKPDTLSTWDRNLYWRPGGEELLFMDDDLPAWQQLGIDRQSLLADPLVADLAANDYRLAATSPAVTRLGFERWDYTACGLYGDPAWVAGPRAVAHPEQPLPSPVHRRSGPHRDDFEGYPPGAAPDQLVVSRGEGRGGDISVTAELAASGQQCLKLQDAAGLQPSWQPHCFWQPGLRRGTAVLRFAARRAPGAIVWTEWRSGGYPYAVGPSLRWEANGELRAGARLLGSFPDDTWVAFEITAALGDGARGQWSLQATAPGRPPVQATDLPCDPAFRRLEWLGFVSLADLATACYLDDVDLAVR